MHKTILLTLLAFLTSFNGSLKTELNPHVLATTSCVKKKDDGLSTIHLEAKQRWQQELFDIVAAHEEVAKKIMTGQTQSEKEGNEKHFKNLQADIVKAIIAAPEGKPALFLGAGQLRDVPEELFKKYLKKFPKIYLVDAVAQPTIAALTQRGHDTLLNNGKIEIVQTDLSMIHPEFILEIEKVVRDSINLADAKKKLIQLFNRFEKNSTLVDIPTPLKNKEFGLVVSSTLLPNTTTFNNLIIDRMLARRFNLSPPNQPSQSLFSGKQEHRDYDIALFSIFKSFCYAHSQLYKDLVSQDGIVYFAANFGILNSGLFSNEMKFFFIMQGLTDLTLEKIVASFNSFAQSCSDLIPGLTKAIAAPVVVLTQLSQQGMPLLFNSMVPIPVLNFKRPQDKNFWTDDMQVLETRVWEWVGGAPAGDIPLIQSLRLKPKKSLSSLKEQIAAKNVQIQTSL